MSTVTEKRESALAMAQRTLERLGRLEEEHSGWLEALRAQELLETAGYYGLEEADWEDAAARETVRLYLERQAEEGYQSDYVSEDADPVWQWLESSLDAATIWESRGDSEPERRGWELLLGYGGPDLGLELKSDGRATVWANHWGPTERAYGRLEWLANYLEELGL